MFGRKNTKETEQAETTEVTQKDRPMKTAEQLETVEAADRMTEKMENKTRKVKKAKAKKEKTPKPRNPKVERVIAWMNRYSILLQMLLTCSVCFVIEWISRHSFLEACEFVTDRNLVYLYNSFLIWATLTLVYLVKRRIAARVLICAFWLFLGTINGCVLAKRVSPFGWTDLKMVGDLFTMKSSYFSDTEAAIVIGAVAAVCVLLVLLWIKGPKYQGKIHRLAGMFMVVLVVALIVPNVTDAAKSSNVLASYFENLAQGYKDYGFVYSFSSSALDQGMSTPSGYSEEAVQAVLDHISSALDEDTQTDAATDVDTLSNAGASLVQVCGVKTCSSSEDDSSEEADTVDSVETEEIAEETGKDSGDSDETEATAAETEISEETEDAGSTGSSYDWEYPNIIVVLLESFVNPDMITFLETSEEAVPNFEYLTENYTSGYVEVPVVGAGTANTEFEILTGMSMQFFGLGEYPYKTILKETNCESIASDLATLGYGTHVVHNNGGNFYSRANAFSQMGFDTFTSKELMDIQEYTPLGTWATDEILVGEVEKSLDYTPDQQDFVYTITVGSHGDYPQYEVLEDPKITISGVEDEGMAYAWEYYVNMLYEVDEFIGDLIEMLEERGEPTYVVMFGDHLPTMDLTEEDMTTGSLFLTPYVTWNNLGLEKNDSDMTSYQLLADTLETLGMGGVGTMFSFHQSRDSYETEEEYTDAMELLQYDILYGEHYVYGGENPYPASDLIMGTEEVVIDRIVVTDSYYYIVGSNFTNWSKVYVNGEKVSTTYYSSRLLRVKKSKIPEGTNTIVVNQVGSSSTIFHSSNEVELVVGSETETETQTDTLEQ
ncbi:MAG: LTA synthase family protein [Clostridiales bacterium]|nr:LTA synthase family protein [Clostridiales bacterium]